MQELLDILLLQIVHRQIFFAPRLRHLQPEDLLAAVVAAAEPPAERLFEERRDRADSLQDMHARPRDAERAAAVIEGVLAIDQHAPDAVARQHQRRRHPDRPGAHDQDGVSCRGAVKLGDAPGRKARIVEVERIQRSLAGRSHAFLRLSLAVEKSLHQPLRLAGQETTARILGDQVDGLVSGSSSHLRQQRLLRAQRFGAAFEQAGQSISTAASSPPSSRPRRPGPRRARWARR